VTLAYRYQCFANPTKGDNAMSDWTNTIERTTFKIGAVELPDIQVKGAPAVASTSEGRLDVFVRGSVRDREDDHLYHNVLVDDKWWTNWEDISEGHKIKTSPAAVAFGSNEVDVFAVWAEDGHVHHRVLNYKNSKWVWDPWKENLDGLTDSAPAAVSFPPTIKKVFVRGTDNALDQRMWKKDVDKWTDWFDFDVINNFDRQLYSAPAAVASAPGHIDFFGVNANGYLQHRREDNGEVNAWFPIEGDFTIQDAPAAASAITAEGRVDVFVRDTAGHLKKRWFNKKTNPNQLEDKWVDTEGVIYSAPAAVVWYDGTTPKRFDVFAQGKDNTLFHSCWKAR
jgi:hypothetical protein